jgi:branched-chain amino acid transport system ATP-binding protein
VSGGDVLLDVRDVEAAYGPFRALFGVSFTVRRGAAVALLGPNGSGKSTVARVVTGLVPVTAGTIEFDGVDVTRMPAWRLARLGVAHAPEGRSVFASLTVEENLLLALGKSPAALARAYDAFPRLHERRRQHAGTLSGGEQRMLSLARVLADPPALLVVDELSLGLAPVVVQRLIPALENAAKDGVGVLLIEQFVHVALGLAEHAYVIEGGRIVHHGTARELREHPERLHSAYLLRERRDAAELLEESE